jgi:RimJ/RimL family protein N-acetyltransferase
MCRPGKRAACPYCRQTQRDCGRRQERRRDETVSRVVVRDYAPGWPIETARLLLRPFQIADLDALYAIHSDEGVVRYL